MALSASFDFTVARTAIIEAALRKLGVLAEGQSASAAQLTTGSETLNLMLQAFTVDGLPLWYLKTVYVYPVSNVNRLLIGPSGGHASEELIITKLMADSATSDTTIDISTTSAIDVQGTFANSDYVGVELDDGTMHWTTVSSGGGTSTLTLASGVASAASTGNRVYGYTAKPQRPEAVVEGWIINAVSQGRRPINVEAESHIRSIGNLTSEGEIVTGNYIPLLTNGQFTVWPRWPNGKTYLELRVQYPFDDMDGATNDLAFPRYWNEAIIYNLALRLTTEYTVPDSTMKFIAAFAEKTHNTALSFGGEGTSLKVSPRTQ